MQQKVNMTWIGLSSTEWRGLTDNDMLWRGSAGRDAGLGRTECEEAKVAGPACRSLWEGPSPRLNWERGRGCAGLRLHHISASLRTEAQGTRKSSEAARGVFSRIMKKFFFFFLLTVYGSSAHLNWSAKYTWGNEQIYAHVYTCTFLLHVHSLLVHKFHLSVSIPAGWVCFLDWNISPQWSRCKGSCHHVHTWFESLDKIRREWFFKREEKNLRGNPLQSSFIKWISQKRVFGCPDLLSFWFLPTRRVKLAWLVEYSTLNMIARAGSVPERWASVEGGSLCCGWLGCEDWASAQCLILTALWMILGQTLH